MLDKKRFPIGVFSLPEEVSQRLIEKWIASISDLPSELAAAVEGLSEEQLDTPYRPGGWTVRQVVHHCADSHMNAFCRFKLSLTEDKPSIKPYLEHRWAELEDGRELPVQSSLAIIQGLHLRWTILLKSLSADDLKRSYIHPEHGREITLTEALGMYAWHGAHHLAHIKMTLPEFPKA
ncbi:YfiT family bacillithiol transferase [Pedobacter deserti]|uniref:YfiT family bacillithiol transferase n=1 Tax=Pedobacter deserti TaxID=2817382 RepID=UPI00210D3093|nr:bacillithiol transferase BstA [Pedobacter sp. SYSU D00382]